MWGWYCLSIFVKSASIPSAYCLGCGKVNSRRKGPDVDKLLTLVDRARFELAIN